MRNEILLRYVKRTLRTINVIYYTLSKKVTIFVTYRQS